MKKINIITNAPKELLKKLRLAGIIYDTSDREDDYYYRPEYIMSEEFVCMTDEYIITLFRSEVLPDSFRIYDAETLEIVAMQDRCPEYRFFAGGDKWSSSILK